MRYLSPNPVIRRDELTPIDGVIEDPMDSPRREQTREFWDTLHKLYTPSERELELEEIRWAERSGPVHTIQRFRAQAQ